MKRYIKSYNYINLDDDIDNLIEEFDPYIDEAHREDEAEDYTYFAALVKDKNSDFSEWIDVQVDNDTGSVEWDWNRQIFFDKNYTDDKNIRKILNDINVSQKVDEIVYDLFGAY